LKYWPNPHDFNKLVIKVKMHAKVYNFFFQNFLFMEIQCDFFFCLRDWLYA
jgi:hypothetical protein